MAEDKASGLALLRLYGAGELKPLPLGEAMRSGEITLVGIADPEAQAGNAAATAIKVHAASDSGTNAIEPSPVAGFAGAAAIDSEAGFAGIVTQKPQVVAGPPTAAGQAAIAPADAIHRLLAAQNIAPATGHASADAAKTSVVRVICVRK